MQKRPTETEIIKFLWEFSQRSYDDDEFGEGTESYPEALAQMLMVHFEMYHR